MVFETVLELCDLYDNKVPIGVLGTTGTFKTRVYSDPLRRKGFSLVLPSEELQSQFIQPAIYHPDYGIKSSRIGELAKAVDLINFAISQLEDEGAKVIILGCTELSMIKSQVQGTSIIIDPLTILARSLIRNFREMKMQR